MFAIASLRALYGLVATVLAELRFLEKAIAVVLAWIGVKMIIEARATLRGTMPAELQRRARVSQAPGHARSRGATEALTSAAESCSEQRTAERHALSLASLPPGCPGGPHVRCEGKRLSDVLRVRAAGRGLPDQHRAEPGRGRVDAQRGRGRQRAAARGPGGRRGGRRRGPAAALTPRSEPAPRPAPDLGSTAAARSEQRERFGSLSGVPAVAHGRALQRMPPPPLRPWLLYFAGAPEASRYPGILGTDRARATCWPAACVTARRSAMGGCASCQRLCLGVLVLRSLACALP